VRGNAFVGAGDELCTALVLLARSALVWLNIVVAGSMESTRVENSRE